MIKMGLIGRISMFTVLVFCLVLFLLGYFFAAHSSASKTEVLVEYIVQPGDTLWAIAKAHTSVEDDVRVFIRRLQSVNKLNNPVIQPGQCLLLPTP